VVKVTERITAVTNWRSEPGRACGWSLYSIPAVIKKLLGIRLERKNIDNEKAYGHEIMINMMYGDE